MHKSCSGRATRYALLVVLQAMDAAGKDGAIEHVMSGVNPQGVQVVRFRKPSPEELDHNFLWRTRKPCRNEDASASSTARTTRRSLLCGCIPSGSTQKLPSATPRAGDLGKALRGHQYLRASPRPQRDEDREVLPPRLEGGAEEAVLRAARRARKEWKFNAADVAERARWDDYTAAFEGAITATSTTWAPWHVIPADHKWLTQALVVPNPRRHHPVARSQWPEVFEGEHKANLEARRRLGAGALSPRRQQRARRKARTRLLRGVTTMVVLPRPR